MHSPHMIKMQDYILQKATESYNEKVWPSVSCRFSIYMYKWQFPLSSSTATPVIVLIRKLR